MTAEAIEALRAIHVEIERVWQGVTAEQWAQPSACAGWRVQDVLAHMSSTMKDTVEPAEPDPDAPPPPEHAEEMVDAMVAVRRDWSPDELLAEYEQYREPWLAGLAALQEEPMASTITPLADLGEYPLHLLANAYAFDHYCHLWIDLLGPDAPLDQAAAGAPTDAMVRPGIDWMIAGLPRMQPAEMSATVTEPLRLSLTGPGGGDWLISPAEGAELVSITELADPTSAETTATITSSAHDFVRWGTKRSAWRDQCTLEGDPSAAQPFLDALNII